MFRIVLSVPLAVLFVLFTAPAVFAAERVVVIPMKSSIAAQEKELYIPATAFRPVSAFVGGSWKLDGAMLAPNGAGNWNAPLLLPMGTTIISLELFWNNFDYNTGSSRVVLHVLNLANGGAAQMVTMSSNTGDPGIKSVKTNPINIAIGADLKFSVLVYLGNEDRWLVGVKVVYRE